MTIVTKSSITLSNVNDGATGVPGPKGVDGTDAPTITVKSYTYSAGSIAKIELTGPNAFKQTVGNRGHNVWVIDTITHSLKEFVSCDTYTTMSFSYNGVSMTLADYLASLTDSIVVIAASDADAVDQNVRNVLNCMGGFPDLGTWSSGRIGHVFIGMSKRNDGTWPLQLRQGYEQVNNKDGSTPEIGCTLSKGGIVANGATGPKGDKGDTGNDGIAGKDGVGIQTTTITYAGSTSGTTVPTSGWAATVPTVAAGSYLWTKTVWSYTDNTSETGYSVAKMGNNGTNGKDGTNGANGTNGKDGTSVTITSKQILYQNSTSGTTAPTGTWSTTIPSTPQGQFRWARTIVNYSDGTSTQTDLVGYVGVDGQVGPQGKPTGITQQATEPSNKYAGMMWQYTGTDNMTIGSTTIAPQVQYVYDGAQWRMYILNVANMSAQTLAAITADLGTVTAGMIKSYIDYTYYNNSATGIPAKAYIRIDANNINQKIALQSPSGVDWGYIRQDVNGITIFADTKNAGTIGNASGRYVSTNYGGSGISFINSNNASINANGDLDVATPYTGTGSLYFDGTNLISSAPIIALNTIVKSYAFYVNGLGIRLDRLMSQVMVTFSGQVTSAIKNTPTFNNQLPNGFRPINASSLDYMVVGNINANGYIYFNPDGSIRFMANVPQGAYIRGTRSYLTADAYPS